jgi:hypothetical protein
VLRQDSHEQVEIRRLVMNHENVAFLLSILRRSHKAHLGQETMESVPAIEETAQHRLPLAACNCGYDQKGLRSRGDRMGQWRIWDFM